MNLISIIIPVYNVQEFLGKCVNSVSSQTYRNIEIILVNGGSTDDSGDLCETLANQDNRISVIYQKNGGLSDARNTGAKAAHGDYLFYLDSDDCISMDCLESLYKAILRHGAEVAQTNFYYDYTDYLLYNNNLKGKDKVFTREGAMRSLLEQEVIKNFAWGKLIRADIAKKHLFPKGKYFEDTFWKFYIIHECTTYVALAEPKLYYLQRSTSISGSFTDKNMDQIEGEALRLDFIKEHYAANYYNKSLRFFNDKILKFKQHIINSPSDQKSWFENELNKYIDKYNLKNHLAIAYLIHENKILRKGFNLYKRISGRLISHNLWVKIKKND